MRKIAIRCGLMLPLLVLVFAACSSQPTPLNSTPTAAPSSRGGTLAGSIIAGGRVTPATSAALSFPIGGTVKQVPTTLGAHVEAGAVLARLDDTILQKQMAQTQAQLEIARKQQAQSAAQKALAEKQLAALKVGGSEADIAAAQAALIAAQANYLQVKQGPTADELALLKANADNAKAALDQAQSAYDRIGGANNPAIGLTREALQLQQSTNAYTAALAAYDDARSHPTQAELAAAYAQIQQAQGALSRLTPTPASLDVAQAQVDAAKATVELAQSQVDSAQAALDTANSQESQFVLSAPFAGTVTTLDIGVGEFATPGSPVLRLADTSTWQVQTTDLTELNIASVKEGIPVSMTFDAIPGLDLTGKVDKIKPYGDTKQGDIVYTVIISLDQQDPRLRWNMTAKVSIQPQQ